MLALDSTVQDALRLIGAVNAVCMLLGQMWYTSYWTQQGIAAFVLGPPTEHILLRLGSASCILLAAAMYYITFAVVFAWGSTRQTEGLAHSYALVACAWHAWVAVFLVYASARSRVENPA